MPTLPAFRRIAAEIGAKISSGQLKPGEKLPSGRQLQEQYDVSEIVIRQAVMLLRERGLVESVPGVGVFVTSEPTEG